MNFDPATIPFGIIDLIKMFRSINTLGLAESKWATERFLSVYNFFRSDEGYYDLTKAQIQRFVKYAGLFAKGDLVIEKDGEIFPGGHHAVSDYDIMNVVG